jgi:hypothetical protein
MGTMVTVGYAATYVHRGRYLPQSRQAPQGDVPQALRACVPAWRPDDDQDTEPRPTVGRSVLVTRHQGAGMLALARRVEPRDWIRPLDRAAGREVRYQGRAPMGVYPDVRPTSGWDGSGPSLPYSALYPAGSSRGRHSAREHAPVPYRCGRRKRAQDRVREWPQAGGGQRVPTP